MKRFQVHVDDRSKSIAFYSKLFAAEPTREENAFLAAIPRSSLSLSQSTR